MSDAKKIVDAWNAKCEKAERALDRAVKRFNEAPDDATQEEINKRSKAMRNAQGKLQELYDNLPGSVDDVTAEYEAQQREDKMVASGQVTPRKMKRITADQIAQVVHRYLSNRPTLDAMHDVILKRHEWIIQEAISYDIAHEDIPTHDDVIIGSIWVEPQTEEGKVTGWGMGYGLPRGKLRSQNAFRLAREFRGACRAVDNEFHFSKKWDDFVPELPKPNEEDSPADFTEPI